MTSQILYITVELMSKFKLGSTGVISPVLIIIIIIVCVSGIWFYNLSAAKTSSSAYTNRAKSDNNSTAIQTNTQQSAQKPSSSEELKKDKDWMYKYCVQEIAKLPEAPFKYRSKIGPARNGPMVWVSEFFPKGTRFDHQSGCAMDYKYDEKEAYASLGVKYGATIESVNEFEKRVDEMLTSKIDSSWKKISPLGKQQRGTPGYAYNGFPMVFTRENKVLGTVEYIDIFFGGKVIYIKIEFYAK